MIILLTFASVTDLHSFLAEAKEEDKPALLETINKYLFEDEEEIDGAPGESKSKEKPENEKPQTDFRFDSIYQFLDCPIMRNLTIGGI